MRATGFIKLSGSDKERPPVALRQFKITCLSFPHEESRGLGCTDKDRQTLSLVLITGKGEKRYILLSSKGAQH